jgi:hypothetical protein
MADSDRGHSAAEFCGSCSDIKPALAAHEFDKTGMCPKHTGDGNEGTGQLLRAFSAVVLTKACGCGFILGTVLKK